MPKTKRKGGSAKIEPLSREHFTFRKVGGRLARYWRRVREQDRSREWQVSQGRDPVLSTAVILKQQAISGSRLGSSVLGELAF